MRNLIWTALVGLVVSYGTMLTAHAAPWRVEVLEQPGTVAFDLESDRPRLTTTIDGSLLAYPLSMRIRDNLDGDGYSAFARLGTTGATETFSTGTLGVNVEGTLLADGSLITVATTVDRVASDGTLVWSVLNPAGAEQGSAHQMSNGDLLLVAPAAPGLQMRALALSNGAVVGTTVVVPTSSQCYGLKTVGDGNGSWYVASSCIPSRIVKLLESPLRLDGNWQPTPAITGLANEAGNVAFKNGALYAVISTSSTNLLRKLDALSGAALWTYPATGDDFRVGGILDTDGGEILLRGWDAVYAPALQRVDASTGSLLWAHMPVGYVADAVSTASDVIIGGTTGSIFDIDQAGGFIERISLASGVSSWQTTLTAPQGGGSTLSAVAIQGNQAVAIGAGCPAAGSGRAKCDATLWRNVLATGVSVEAAAVKVRTGNSHVGIVESPPTQPIVATLEMGSAGPQLHIRRFQGSDGATTLDIVTPVQMTYPWLLPESAKVIQAGDGNFAALFTIAYRMNLESDAVVMKIDASTGDVQWRRSLRDPSQGPQDLSIVQIASDSDGGIFFDAAYEYPSAPRKESVVKLDSVTGDVVWMFSFPNNAFSLLQSGVAAMLGDDVLIYSYPGFPGGAGWQRRRGTDGGAIWSATTLPVFPSVVGNDYIYGSSTIANTVTVVRIDPHTGATLCSGTHVSTGDSSIYNPDLLRGSDGDIYVAARRQIASISKAIAIKFSGSTCVPQWANQFDETTSPNAQFYPRFVDGGVFYLSGRPSSFEQAPANILTMVSSINGSLISSQLMYQSSWRDPSSVRASGWPFGLDTDGGLILMASSREPGQPTRTVIEKRAAPSSAVTGALHIAAKMIAASTPASAGFDFVITVVNDGGSIAPNVRTVANFGVDVRLENATCSLAGSPCQASVVGSTIGSTSDLAVGTTLTLTGRASVPAASTAQISLTGSAFSPYGFAEINHADNILPVMPPFRDYIFRNGVESTP